MNAYASNKLITNFCEGKKLSEDVVQSGLIGGVIKGSTVALNKYVMHLLTRRLLNALTNKFQEMVMDELKRVLIESDKEGSQNVNEIDIALRAWDLNALKRVLVESGKNVNEIEIVLDIHELLDLEKLNRMLYCGQLYYESLKIERNFGFLRLPRGGAILEDALKQKSVSFVDEAYSMAELIPRVVLVQALENETWCHYSETDYIRIETDPDYQALCCIKGVITQEGRVGHHLDLDKRQYLETMADRPHLHWSWNQLVQSHNDGNWDESKIAILEPLSTFENSVNSLPFGIAPYDTFTFGAHRLSKDSTILIPENLIGEVKAYLANFQGRLATYNPLEHNLRSAVIDALHENYPKTWPICDEEGQLIGKEMKKTTTGYSPLTCLLQDDGKILRLITNEGKREEDRYGAMKEYADTSNRFIGLHVNSITFQLEGNEYFKALQKFTSKPTTANNSKLFAGSVNNAESLADLGSIQALEFYKKLLGYNPKTGVLSIANYIMNEALHADLVSLFYQMNPEAHKCDLSPLELNMIFSSTQQLELITLLDCICETPQSAESFKSFQLYCTILKECFNEMNKAKKAALLFSEIQELDDDPNDQKVLPLCFIVGQKVWKEIEEPEDITFDLGKNWPLSKNQYVLVYKILRTLPDDYEQLKKLYRYVSSLTRQNCLENRKEKYRLNIICSVIQWAFQEKKYLESKGDIQLLSWPISYQKWWDGSKNIIL